MSKTSGTDPIHYFYSMQQDLRVDGRSRLDYRSGELIMNPVSNAHGSLRLKLAETDVMVSGRVDLGVPDAETPLLGKVIFSVDW